MYTHTDTVIRYTHTHIMFYTHTPYSLFIHQWTLGLLPSFDYCEGCSYELGCTHIYLSPWSLLLPRSGGAGSYANSMFKVFFFFLKHPITHYGFSMVRSHRWCQRVPTSPHLCQPLFFSALRNQCKRPSAGVESFSAPSQASWENAISLPPRSSSCQIQEIVPQLGKRSQVPLGSTAKVLCLFPSLYGTPQHSKFISFALLWLC